MSSFFPLSPPAHSFFIGPTVINIQTARMPTQSSTVLARPVCPHVCDSDSARVPASPPYACSSPSHANRSTGQRNTTQSSTVLARPVCPHVCDSDSARATTPSFLSPCGLPLLPSLRRRTADNLSYPRRSPGLEHSDWIHPGDSD